MDLQNIEIVGGNGQLLLVSHHFLDINMQRRVFVNARLHVSGGALGGGRMVEDSLSVAVLDTAVGVWCDTKSIVTTPRTGRYSVDATGGDAAVELMRRCRHVAAAIGDLIFIYGGLRGGKMSQQNTQFLSLSNETHIKELEIEAKVLDIRSPCSMDIDSQTNNQLPQVITSEETSTAACDDKPDRLEIARLYNEKLDVNEPTCEQTEPSTTGHWKEKELVSRDGQAKLKANVFFASFDQRSDKAAEESTCIVDVNTYHIINTFGELLFEGCNQAYILRFDDAALIRGKVEKEGASSDQASEDEICSGKECCREFMKRFLAAIPLRELESEKKKELVSYFALYQRLQIEFNFTTSLSLSSSSLASSTNSTSSLLSNESTNR
ncbi:Serine/threonine-protein phosphatase BSL3 [Camellia lanceoleosa]|uniref:Serine/threonine-protein phosphatase BSL3 n=1 Tax=Camellia lanceoleosa TaxID=1840588 RepID=A0ACC0IAP7_9ERIC|nr:Serine/threonine-protein phosphatase BSL3 [Camellia lanceoleosa]